MKAWKRGLALLSAVFLMRAARASANDLRFGMVNGISGTGSVNLRSLPDIESEKLGRYERGEWVTILYDDGNGWYYVVGQDGRAGYMSSQYIETSLTDHYGVIGIVSNPEGTSFLNLRATPSYSGKVLGYYYNGVPFMILGVDGSGWYHVRVNGVEGYFRSEFVVQSTTYYSEKVATIVTPNNTAMNMRSGPDRSYSIIKQFEGGRYVMVLNQGASWWRVSCDGYVGYMDASFLKEGVYTPDGQSSLLTENIIVNPTAIPVTPVKPVVNPIDKTKAYAVVTNPKETQVLNMRLQPDSSTDIIAQYANGTHMEVLKQGVEWCKVRNSSGELGYMMTDFLTLYNLPETPSVRVNHPQHTYVYLRSLASKNSGMIMATVPHGALVTVMIPGDTWTKVRYNGQTGYMMSVFLTK